ncbi:hypothetical protein IAR50_005278 [Cryptococcus sp. DSM 104548]
MQAPPPYQPSASAAPAHVPANDAQGFIINGPGLNGRTTFSTHNAQVNIWLDVKDALPELPVTFAPKVKEYAIDEEGEVPAMDVLVLAVGSADDVRLLTTLAAQLVLYHNHRVRIATQEQHEHIILHAKDSLVGKTSRDGERLDLKLEYYAVSASPEASLKTWVQDPSTLEKTLHSLFQATFTPSTAISRPFAADLVIASPNVPGAISIAELLGLPLHIISSTPYSPTVTMPHPNTQVQRSNAPASVNNYLSYPLYDAQIWRALGPTLNTFRITSLGLPAIQRLDAPGLLDRLKVPVSYAWSPYFLVKAGDWQEHIDVTGFILDKDSGLDNAEEEYRPTDEMLYFVKGGREPIYVKLDSIPEEEISEVVSLLISAALKSNKRLIVDVKGYYNKAGDNPDILIISRTSPLTLSHRSRFHTTQLYQLSLSPSPIPLPTLNIEGLMDAFSQAEGLWAGAKEMGQAVGREDGVRGCVGSLERHLPLANMRCDIVPARVAVWHHAGLEMHLSAVAAGVLVDAGKISFKDLSPNRSKEYPTTQADADPLTGGAGSFLSSLTDSILSVLPHFSPSSTPPQPIDLPSRQPLLIAQTQTPAGTWSWEYQQASRVRRPITGWKSGLKEARDEAWTGVKDGAKGFLKAPVDGLVNKGPIGGVLGIVGGTVGLVTRPLRGGITAVAYGAQGAMREFDSSAKQAKLASSSPADSLRPPRREASKYLASAVSSEDKRKILEEFKRAKGEEGVKQRKAGSEAVANGQELVRRGRGVVIGPLDLNAGFANLSIGSPGEEGEKKWWKGKGKGKERMDGLSPQVSGSGSGPGSRLSPSSSSGV